MLKVSFELISAKGPAYLSSGKSGAAEREIFKVWVRSVGAGRVVTGGEGCWVGRSQHHLLLLLCCVALRCRPLALGVRGVLKRGAEAWC